MRVGCSVRFLARSAGAMIILLGLTASWVRGQPVSDSRPSVSVAMVLDDSTQRHVRAAEHIRDEVRAVAQTTHRVQFPDDRVRVLEDRDNPQRVVAELQRGPAPPALLIAVGVEASHRAATQDNRPVPVVAAHIIDPGLQGLPQTDEGSGRTNLAYAAPSLLDQNLSFLRSIRSVAAPALLVPEGLIANEADLEAQMKQWLAEQGPDGTTGHVVPIGATAEETAAALPEEADAAYLVPPLSLSPVETDRLLAALNAKRLPTVVHRGRDLVDRGALATSFAPTTNPIPRRTALHAHNILEGTAPGSLAVARSVTEQPVVNEATAEQLGMSLPSDLRLRTTLTETGPAERRDSVRYGEAIREGVRANYGLQSERAEVEQRRQDIRIERADLLPQLQFEGRAVTVNEDQAAASFGAQPERSLEGTIALSQTLYSGREYTQVDLAQRRREAQKAQVRTSEQDVALRTAQAYVTVLRARTAAEVQRGNLSLARENLSLAESRREAGEVGRRAVLRLQTQVAQSRRAVVAAEAQVRVARTQLQQVLTEPMDGTVRVAPLTAQDTVLTLTEEVFARYGHSSESRNRLATFLVEAGRSKAPALQALDAQIKASKRSLRANQRSYWAPTVSLEGAVNSRVLEGGVGTGGGGAPPNLNVEIPQQPSTNWNVGVSLRLPLFTGFRRDGEIERAHVQVRQLADKRREVRTRLEEQIRSQTEQATARYRGLREAEAAHATAEETLALVQESYASGIAGVIDLIDAQEAALRTRLSEVEARHDFLLQIVRTERSISRTGPLQTAADRAAFRERLASFMAREE